MIVPPSGVRVWLATGTTDMRRGMNSLALQVQEVLHRNPHAGDLYVFRGRRGSACRSTPSDWNAANSSVDGALAITAAQLCYMLEGIDWRNPQRTWRPELAG